MTVPLTKRVKSGEKLAVMFYAKLARAEPGVTTAKISLRIQVATKPYPSFANKPVKVTRDWKLYSTDAVADKHHGADALTTAFQSNTAKQAIAMGVVAVFDQGQ